MSYIWLVLIFPLVWPWIAKAIWGKDFTQAEFTINIVAACLLVTGVYMAGRYSEMADVEVLNGEVTRKVVETVPCSHSYDCNCRNVQSCTGSGKDRSCSTTRVCDTCYEHSNDYDHDLKTNVGTITVNRVDRQGVMAPPRWTAARIGDPVAMLHEYTNYVKAARDSLFHDDATHLTAFKDQVPAYPLNIQDYHYLNRFLTVGIKVPDEREWNIDIMNVLKKVGPERQMNLVVVVVNTADPNYIYALKAAWSGAKKNDAVIAIGVTNYPEISWVRVHSWSKNEMFNVEMRDEIWDLKTLDREKIMSVIAKTSMDQFQRRSMKEFEYLKASIEPPTWAIVLAGILGVVASLGLSMFFSRPNVNIRFPWEK
jgi:hypothetical protein